MTSIEAKAYYPHIDGLRAVAVLLVFLFHLDIQFFKGGYIGVDIFFVISGYLITKNIVGLKAKDEFSFKNFYIRRFRRLYPSLLMVVIFTVIVACFVFSSADLERVGFSAIASLLSFSNIFFWYESGYFDVSSTFKPLLHTWSLSVEEQFYLLWPMSVVFLLSFGKSRLFYFVVILLFTVLIAFISRYFSLNFPSWSFYLLPFRLFEFSIGAMLVFLPGSIASSNIKTTIVTVVGVLLIAVPSVTFSEDTVFPSYSALIPALGAALIIRSGGGALTGFLFERKALVFIGLISYVLYLTHWPVIVFYKYIHLSDLSSVDRIIIVLVASSLALALHYFIEKPFRFGMVSNSSFLKSTLLATLISLFGFGFIYKTQGFESFLPPELSVIAKSIGSGYEDRKLELACLKSGTCHNAGSKSVLVIGDSYAEDYALAFSSAFSDMNISMITSDGCKALLGYVDKRWKKNKVRRCTIYRDRVFDIDFSLYDYVVIGHSWSYSSLKHIEESLAKISSYNTNIFVVGQKVTLRRTPSEILAKSNSLTKFVNITLESLNVKDAVSVNTELREYADSVNAQFIDPVVCQNGAKFDNLNDDGTVFFYDRGHFTISAANTFGRCLKNNLDFSI
jgi:peptidoglycan/LPS O-acetylase OafA/YrhL